MDPVNRLSDLHSHLNRPPKATHSECLTNLDTPISHHFIPPNATHLLPTHLEKAFSAACAGRLAQTISRDSKNLRGAANFTARLEPARAAHYRIDERRQNAQIPTYYHNALRVRADAWLLPSPATTPAAQPGTASSLTPTDPTSITVNSTYGLTRHSEKIQDGRDGGQERSEEKMNIGPDSAYQKKPLTLTR